MGDRERRTGNGGSTERQMKIHLWESKWFSGNILWALLVLHAAWEPGSRLTPCLSLGSMAAPAAHPWLPLWGSGAGQSLWGTQVGGGHELPCAGHSQFQSAPRPAGVAGPHQSSHQREEPVVPLPKQVADKVAAGRGRRHSGRPSRKHDRGEVNVKRGVWRNKMEEPHGIVLRTRLEAHTWKRHSHHVWEGTCEELQLSKKAAAEIETMAHWSLPPVPPVTVPKGRGGQSTTCSKNKGSWD